MAIHALPSDERTTTIAHTPIHDADNPTTHTHGPIHQPMPIPQTHTSSYTSSAATTTAMQKHQEIKTQLQPANHLPHLGPSEQILLVAPNSVEHGVAQGAVLAGGPRVGLARGHEEVGGRPVAV